MSIKDFAPHAIFSTEEIPDAPAYVVMRDPFFSGWGPAADKDAFYVYVCASHDEARAVRDHAKGRGDQEMIRVTRDKSRIVVRDDRLVQLKTRENSPAWYPKEEE